MQHPLETFFPFIMTKSIQTVDDLIEDFPTSRRGEELSTTPKPQLVTLAAADEEDDDEASHSFHTLREGTFIYCPLNRRGSACDSVSSSVTCSVVSHASEGIMGHFDITNSMNLGMSTGFARGSVPRRGSAGFGDNHNGHVSRRSSAGYCGYLPGKTSGCGSAGYGRCRGYGTILAGRRSSTGGVDHTTNGKFDPLDELFFLDGIDESGSLVISANELQLDTETFEKLTMQGHVRDSLSMNHARGVPKIMSIGADICSDGFNTESFTTNATLPGFPRDSISMINERGALKRIHQVQQVPRLATKDDGIDSNPSRLETIFNNALDAFSRHNVCSNHAQHCLKSDIKQWDQREQEHLEPAPKMPKPKRLSNRTGKRRGHVECII